MKHPMSDGIAVRVRFWWLWLRLSLCLQGVVLVIAFIVGCLRAATQFPLYRRDDEGWLFFWSVVAACLAVGVSLPYWWLKRYYLSAEGIHRADKQPNWRSVPAIYWNRVGVVQRRHGWLTGRWLRVVSEYGVVITLPERPAGFGRFRDAVERFAGPDHPLALALAEVAEEG